MQNSTENRPPCGPEMSRNMAKISDQNCHLDVQKHRPGVMSEWPDRQTEIRLQMLEIRKPKKSTKNPTMEPDLAPARSFDTELSGTSR